MRLAIKSTFPHDAVIYILYENEGLTRRIGVVLVFAFIIFVNTIYNCVILIFGTNTGVDVSISKHAQFNRFLKNIYVYLRKKLHAFEEYNVCFYEMLTKLSLRLYTLLCRRR